MKKHVKWITVVAIALMILCMVIYIVTLDDSQPLPVPKVTTTTPK